MFEKDLIFFYLLVCSVLKSSVVFTLLETAIIIIALVFLYNIFGVGTFSMDTWHYRT
jgi:hypothetical protein